MISEFPITTAWRVFSLWTEERLQH